MVKVNVNREESLEDKITLRKEQQQQQEEQEQEGLEQEEQDDESPCIEEERS